MVGIAYPIIIAILCYIFINKLRFEYFAVLFIYLLVNFVIYCVMCFFYEKRKEIFYENFKKNKNNKLIELN